MSDKVVTPEGEGWGRAGETDEAPPSPLEQAIPAERWRRFTPPALIEDSDTDVVVEDGHISRAADVTWSKDSLNKIKAGYQCLNCWEPQQEPFPIRCGFCGYTMRASQADDYEKEFRGEKWVGPAISLEEHLAELEEKTERKTHKPGSSIIIPDWVKL